MPSLSVPNSFSAGTVADASQVNANFDAVETWGNGTLSDDNFSASAGMYTAYRTIRGMSCRILNSTGAAGDYIPLQGGTIIAETVDTNAGYPLFYLDDADFTITGRTPKLRIRAQAYANATTPACTFTVGLYPVSSVTGAAGAFQATLGAVTSGSTVAFSPSANTTNQGNSGDFAFPADGHYVLGVNLSTTPAANTFVNLSAELQVRWT